MILFTIRYIWTCRNNKIFKNVVQTSDISVKITLGITAEFWTNSNLPKPLLPHNWSKLNTDGSMSKYLLGGGGCIRDENGN